jgi:ABC-type uncharacterized transport system involved in gliding motility auxiliary subunit
VKVEALSRWSWVFGVLGVLCLVTAASIYGVTGESGPYFTGFALAAGVLLASYASLDRERVVAGVSSRAFRHGSGAGALVLLALGLSIGLYVLAKRHDERWDATGEGKFTLSEQTVGILSGLDKDVKIVAFFREESPEQTKFQDLVDGFKGESARLSVEFHDPLREPLVAQQYTITTEYGTVVLESGEDKQRIESKFDEESLANAIVRLVSGADHRLCWTVGHGESDPDDDSAPDGLGAVVVKLEQQNYTVTKTNVLEEGIAPECEAVVIARPLQEWVPQEREALAAFIAGGGKALVLLEPETVPELAADLERYGVAVGRDIVLENSRGNQLMGLDLSFVVMSAEQYGPHPIMAKLNAITIFGIARSISAVPGVDGLQVTELAHTSPDAWAETTLDGTSAPQPDEGVDRLGEIPVMVAVEVTDPAVLGVAARAAGLEPEDLDGDARLASLGDLTASLPVADPSLGVPVDFTPKPGGRLVVAGDADFPSNQLMALGNNQDLFTNAIAWLVEEEDQLGEGPEEEGSQTMALTLLEEGLVWLVSVFLVPMAAMAAALGVLIRRRFQ